MQVRFSTVVRALNQLGLGRLQNLEPKLPVQRYKWARPGNLIHIHIKPCHTVGVRHVRTQAPDAQN